MSSKLRKSKVLLVSLSCSSRKNCKAKKESRINSKLRNHFNGDNDDDEEDDEVSSG